jgi:cyclopropane-fatty-acyl-phospholipid synthase
MINFIHSMKTILPSAPGVDEDQAKYWSLRILEQIFGDYHPARFNIRFWDGSLWPDPAPRDATLVLHHPGSLRQMFSGSERALAEAYLTDACDVEGNMEAVLELADILTAKTRGWTCKLHVAYLLKRLPLPPSDSVLEKNHAAHSHGKPHSPDRDRESIRFHYDLSDNFYSLWLDPRMVYSCAYFEKEADSLEEAQLQKLDLICRKLSLKQGQRFLDIGCGWGGLILHAAQCYGVHATGITLSENQAARARERIDALGLQKQVEVRIADYRELKDESYDAIASVGMVEHVGEPNLPGYFTQALRLLREGGLFLNHGITTGSVPRVMEKDSFIDTYVFPDGDLFPIARVLAPAEAAGFEIRDVENLREHYALTLRRWVERLERNHEAVRQITDERIYRIWRLYMAGSAHSFSTGQLAIYQTLLAKLKAGTASVPLTRHGWYPPRMRGRSDIQPSSIPSADG